MLRVKSFKFRIVIVTDLAGVESRVEDAVLVRLVAVVVAERVQRHRAQRVHAQLLLVRLEIVLALQCSADMLRFFENSTNGSTGFDHLLGEDVQKRSRTIK